jgi:prepilin-type N-terminal cleavage/methylation domain-containing protein
MASTAAPGRPDVTARAGFTLVEILVTVGLLALIAALASPMLLADRAERRFAASIEQVQSLAALVRTESMQSGQPIEVFVVSDDTGAWNVRTRSVSGMVEEQASADADAPRARTRITLAPGVRFGEPRDAEGDLVLSPAGPVALEAEQSERFVLLVCLPDGGAAPGEPVSLLDAEGRRADLTVAPWTGSVTLLRTDLDRGSDATGQVMGEDVPDGDEDVIPEALR